MSEKKAGGAKAAKQDTSESKSASPSTSADSTAASDGAAAKSDNAAATSDGGAAPGGKSTKATAAADHSPSYFSSVSTPQYRARWDSVFASGKKSASGKRPARRKNGLPVTISLDPAELDDAVRAGIEAAFRRKAKARRISFDRFMKQAQVTWRLECEFTD